MERVMEGVNYQFGGFRNLYLCCAYESKQILFIHELSLG